MTNIVTFPSATRSAPTNRQRAPGVDSLSFVKRRKRGDGFDYWDVKTTGRYGEDCQLGHSLALEYLDFIGRCPTVGNGTLLTCIVRSMMDHTQEGLLWSGAHVGFLTHVNRYAMAQAAAGKAEP